MNFIPVYENPALRVAPPVAVVFESEYQQSQIRADYECFGVTRFAVIHGAFEPLPFRPLAHEPGTPFVVGRLARPARQKWHPHLWRIFQAVRERGVDVRPLCMGWSPELTQHCGEPPEWATCLAADTISAEEFIARCHTMIAPNSAGCIENWPRVGLESMAAGVPLVVDGRGGWPEQCVDAALYCAETSDYVAVLVQLATDEAYRQSRITSGVSRVQSLGQSPPQSSLAYQWQDLFTSLRAAR